VSAITDVCGGASPQGANLDNLHFSADALRKFGVRYYNEFVKIEDKNKVFTERSTPNQAIRNDIEHL